VTIWHKAGWALVALAAVAAAACGGSGNGDGNEVVLVTHDSFAIPASVKAAFERESGLKLTILQGGDAGEMVNRALLTKGNPQGDALFGIDNNLLSRALDEGLFEAYLPAELDQVDDRYKLDPEGRVTPIDHADVCLDIDKSWFASHGIAPPADLADLTKPQYRKLIVVENPATSTPGLAFLLATVARFGPSRWQGYWKGLRANGVLVVDGWTEAYTARFSGAGGSKGKRPIVVSYGTDPAAEVMFSKKHLTEAPVAVIPGSCFRQVELAGVLAGAKNPKGARKLIDFMLTQEFQAAMPESMFVLPVRDGTPLPAAFRRYAVMPEKPLELPAAEIGSNRDRWIDAWTQAVLR
jgi:thiamine transport system substrate-binding protein